MEQNENKQYKDSVFVDLFCNDEHGIENFLSLYNAIHNSNLTLQNTKIEPMRLEKVLYQKFYNDISMKIGDRIIVLCEHQSTVNYNMPLRCLIYVARLYEKMTDSKIRFARLQQQIATPEFYVFYNGEEELKNGENNVDEIELKLSDAFAKRDDKVLENLKTEIQLELKVKVMNINKKSVLQKLSKCKVLKQYVEFVNKVRELKQTNDVEYMKNAIRESIKNDILKEYLKRKATEVENMLLAEYDYNLDIAVQRDEAMRLGEQQGIRQGIKQGEKKHSIESATKWLLSRIVPDEKIAEMENLSLEEVLEIKAKLGI